jgi:hypothetical protein
MKDRAMSYELHYANDSHEHTAFSSDYQNIDWNAEGCELSVVDEFESLEQCVHAADAFGVGIYLVYRNETASHAIRVVHGAEPEVRMVGTV